MPNFKVTKYPQGTFSWVDCASTDASKARPFYEAVMGWESDDRPMGGGMVYTMFKHDGETVAAISQMQPEVAAQGVPSHWTSYITVEDVDRMAETVKELGGTMLMEPMDVFEEGRMILFLDPTGAEVALWQPKNHIGAGLVNTPGAFSWNELATKDADKAGEFYSKLLGWTLHKDEEMDYRYVQNNGRSNGGIIQMTEEWGDMPPHWMVYFSVADLDKALEAVKANGGKAGTDIIESDKVGRFVVVSDPAGAHFTLIQSSSYEPWVE